MADAMVRLMLAQLLVLWLMAVPSLSQTKPGCQQNCGKINVPYPFGLGDDPNCFHDTNFRLACNTSYDPPLLSVFEDESIPFLNISLQGQVRVTIFAAVDCYANATRTSKAYSITLNLKLWERFRFSDTRNKFVAIGCDTQALISDDADKEFQSGCVSFCRDINSVSNGTCSGIGCCQTAIPNDVESLNITLQSFKNHTQTGNFNPCSYAFLAEEEWFRFFVSDLKTFEERVQRYVHQNLTSAPAVLDWSIGNITCAQAQKDLGSYACGLKTNCSDSTNGPGYHCNCIQGYEGNPYLQDGCQGTSTA